MNKETELNYLRAKLLEAQKLGEPLLQMPEKTNEQHVADIIELVESTMPWFCKSVAEAIAVKGQDLKLHICTSAFGLDVHELHLLGACVQYATLKGIFITFLAMPEYPECKEDIGVTCRRSQRKNLFK